MRILFTTNPLYGHLYPMLPLMNAARQADHDVIVATGPTSLLRCSAMASGSGRSGRQRRECVRSRALPMRIGLRIRLSRWSKPA
jgi:hypothetical protein